MTKLSLYKELSEILSTPFNHNTLPLSLQELQSVIEQLRNYRKPEEVKQRGVKPTRLERACERYTTYRKHVSDYVYENTAIKLPVDSLVSPRFYNTIMEYLGL